MADFLNIKLSPHFTVGEFCNLDKYPDNVPDMQNVVTMAYGCIMILEPARELFGPIIINSGYRNELVNWRVGGVKNSQHMLGQAADIKPANPLVFGALVDRLAANPCVDQLLTGKGWLHVSWNPFAKPRRQVIIDYY